MGSQYIKINNGLSTSIYFRSKVTLVYRLVIQMDEMTSPHSERDPDSEMREIFAFWNSESGKISLEKSGILGSGIWSKAGSRNPESQ